MSNLLKDIFKLNHSLRFIPDDKGLHHLGGVLPDDFSIPQNDFFGGFQYLGVINHSDEWFKWLPFSLHLICPIFTDFKSIYLDYTNPSAPKIVYPENSEEISTAYDEIKRDSFVIYNKTPLSLVRFDGINEDNEDDIIAIAGKPYWLHSKTTPICPHSKKKMKFLAQIFSNGHIKAKEKNFRGETDYYESLFSELNFWVDGDLKIYFEPESKIACYFIQNT